MNKALLGSGYNMVSSLALLSVASLMALAAVAGLIWALRNGCFNNLDKVAADILDDKR